MLHVCAISFLLFVVLTINYSFGLIFDNPKSAQHVLIPFCFIGGFFYKEIWNFTLGRIFGRIEKKRLND
jgi:hypothetical protein